MLLSVLYFLVVPSTHEIQPVKHSLHRLPHKPPCLIHTLILWVKIGDLGKPVFLSNHDASLPFCTNFQFREFLATSERLDFSAISLGYSYYITHPNKHNVTVGFFVSTSSKKQYESIDKTYTRNEEEL